jgi:predicted nuclease of predicted toxin-antitoxin system
MMVKFKLDENLPTEGTTLLTSAGHDAVSVQDQGLGGRPDSDVMAVCHAEGRTLVTLDLHFADIRTYPPHSYAGIIVLRLADLNKKRILTAMSRLVALLEREPLAGRLWIVDDSNVRIRS